MEVSCPSHEKNGSSFNILMSKYDILGVLRSASFEDVKRAYQAAVLETHPDKQINVATENIKKDVST